MTLQDIAGTLTGATALAGLIGAICLWAIRQLVRQEIEPLKEDVAVLRQAVFNHLAHGEQPDEAAIRRRLNHDERE